MKEIVSYGRYIINLLVSVKGVSNYQELFQMIHIDIQELPASPPPLTRFPLPYLIHSCISVFYLRFTHTLLNTHVSLPLSNWLFRVEFKYWTALCHSLIVNLRPTPPPLKPPPTESLIHAEKNKKIKIVSEWRLKTCTEWIVISV